MCQVFALCVIKSSQLGFNVHVQSKLSWAHSLVFSCVVVSSNPVSV